MSDKRILIFGSMGTIADEVERSLVALGADVARVPFEQRKFRDEWGYGRALRNAVAQFSPDIILPVGCQKAMASLVEEFPGIFIPVSSRATIDLLESKVQSTLYAGSIGLRIPDLYSIDRPGEIPEGEVIFKRDSSVGGSGVHRPRTLDALVRLIDHELGKPYLIERYIEGADVSVDCVRLPGKVVAMSSYISLGRLQTQGPSSQRRIIKCPEAERQASLLLDSLDYRGVCGLDFRIGDPVEREGIIEGTPYFLECNPRFTGGLRTQIDSGFDLPRLLVG